MEYRHLFVLVLCATHTAALPYSDVLKTEWDLYKMKFRKSNSTPLEDYVRFSIYMETKSKIMAHNKLYENGEETYEMGPNQFSDMTYEEFATQMTGYQDSSDELCEKENEESIAMTYTPLYNVTDLPAQIDWREKGAVNPVENQGQCGSCWAFTAAGALEGQQFRKTGHLVEISKQNLIDCSGGYGNKGCDGGSMVGAYAYVHYNGGVDSEQSYPYEAQLETCGYRRSDSVATCQGYYLIISDEETMKEVVAVAGPISVGIVANSAFQNYHSGVFSDSTCYPNDVNHGVLIVGYGTEDGSDYWLVKNSWGTSWGEQGYIKMLRGRIHVELLLFLLIQQFRILCFKMRLFLSNPLI